jgi:hypothetical protein
MMKNLKMMKNLRTMISLLEYLNALIVYCNYYHCGQDSKEYRIMCLAIKYKKRWFPEKFFSQETTELQQLNENETFYYYRLVQKYSKHGMK